MDSIYYINRKTGQKEKEAVFGESAIRFLYGTSGMSKTIGRAVLHLFAKWPFLSALYGFLQKLPTSKKKIEPFVKRFDIDTNEFTEDGNTYQSFNDFFIRKLKAEARPIQDGDDVAVIPADGRYRFFEKITKDDAFRVKNKVFCLETVLQDRDLANRYDEGSLVIARLCPTDCHRFYFPFRCTPSKAKFINGKLFSVNPIATRDNPWIWGVNRRVLTLLETNAFGTVCFMEVGATNVGSIIQTYTPGEVQEKGAEKGYFSFGGSALLLFFEPGKMQFDADLLRYSQENPDLEVRCLIGEGFGAKSKAT